MTQTRFSKTVEYLNTIYTLLIYYNISMSFQEFVLFVTYRILRNNEYAICYTPMLIMSIDLLLLKVNSQVKVKIKMIYAIFEYLLK